MKITLSTINNKYLYLFSFYLCPDILVHGAGAGEEVAAVRRQQRMTEIVMTRWDPGHGMATTVPSVLRQRLI